MKIVISDKAKKDIFTALFQTLKNCTNIICVIFYEEYLYIQGMDKSHICLFNVKILNSGSAITESAPFVPAAQDYLQSLPRSKVHWLN